MVAAAAASTLGWMLLRSVALHSVALRSVGCPIRGSQVGGVRFMGSYKDLGAYKDEITGLLLPSGVILKHSKLQQFKFFVKKGVKGWNSLDQRTRATIVEALAKGGLIIATSTGASMMIQSLNERMNKLEARMNALEVLNARFTELEARVNKTEEQYDSRYIKLQASLETLSQEVAVISEKLGSTDTGGHQ